MPTCKESQEGLRSGWSVFVGYFLSMVLKLVTSDVMTMFFVRALFL